MLQDNANICKPTYMYNYLEDSNFSIDGNPLNTSNQFSICYLNLIKRDFSMNQKFKSGSVVLMKKI